MNPRKLREAADALESFDREPETVLRLRAAAEVIEEARWLLLHGAPDSRAVGWENRAMAWLAKTIDNAVPEWPPGIGMPSLPPESQYVTAGQVMQIIHLLGARPTLAGKVQTILNLPDGYLS